MPSVSKNLRRRKAPRGSLPRVGGEAGRDGNLETDEDEADGWGVDFDTQDSVSKRERFRSSTLQKEVGEEEQKVPFPAG